MRQSIEFWPNPWELHKESINMILETISYSQEQDLG